MERELLQQGIQQAKQGNYGQAITTFTQVIELNPNLTEAYYRRGLAFYDSGNLNSAIADYDRSLQINSQQIEVYFSRALAWLTSGNIQGSIMDLQVIFTLDGNYAQAYELQAAIHLKKQEIEHAIENFKQAGRIYLDSQDKINCRRCIAKIRQLEEQQATQQGGITNEDFYAQIEQKIRLGEFKEAGDDCNWLLKTDPYNAKAYHYRGQIDIELGDYVAAKNNLRQAAEYFRSQGNMTESAKMERLCLQLQLKNTIASTSSDFSSSSTTPRFSRTSQPENAIQTRLAMLVGDWNLAQDLVEQLKLSYPGRAEVWYWEQAIRSAENDLS